MRNLLVGGVLGFVLAGVLMIALASGPSMSPRPRPTEYSRLLADVDEGKVDGVIFSGSKLAGRFKDGRPFESFVPHVQIVPTLTDRLLAKGVTVEARPPAEEELPSFASALINWAPLLISYGLFFLVLWFAMARPVLALARQIEAFLKNSQARSSESPSPHPER